MTSVWKLFHLRRYRGGRNAEGEVGLGSPPPYQGPDLRRPRQRYGHGRRCLHHHVEDRDPHHGDSHAGHPCHRSEHEQVQLDRSTSEYGAGNVSGGAASSGVSRVGLIRDDRLPGAVLQARARLFERLRGGSLVGSRQVATSSGIAWDAFLVSDGFNGSNSGDWQAETRRERSPPVIPYVEFEVQAVEEPSFHDVSQKKITGLDWEALCIQQREIFIDSKEREGITRESLECCICLERFQDGDGLVRLECTHRFHPTCLETWLQTTGNCPYCRASILR